LIGQEFVQKEVKEVVADAKKFVELTKEQLDLVSSVLSTPTEKIIVDVLSSFFLSVLSLFFSRPFSYASSSLSFPLPSSHLLSSPLFCLLE
jgi:hypothetical protein